MENNAPIEKRKPSGLDPFRRAVFGGLGVLLPPLLTIVIILWVANTVNSYLLEPIVSSSRKVLVRQYLNEIRPAESVSPELIRNDLSAENQLRPYLRMGDDELVPGSYFDYLVEHDVPPPTQDSGQLIRAYVEHRFLSPYVVVPLFSLGFILILYLLGKFLAAGVGRIFWLQFEKLINRLPLIRNVYSSVKQVTDFMFSNHELEFTRVVAVQYPSKDIWSLAFVTGESLPDLRNSLNEPVMSVLVPTSPMPFTGFTVTVKKSHTLDLNITLDQAFQFIVSCGVVAPPDLIAEAQARK
jgi:uncharacterized membrane protein